MSRRLSLALALACLLCACDAYTSKGDDPAPAADVDAGVGVDAAAAGACVDQRPSYPPGPYGLGEGAIIANLAFTEADGTPLDLGAVHAPCAQKLLLVTTSAGWCTACREEQPKLQALYQDFEARGLVVMVAYFENDDYDPAELSGVVRWKQRYGLSFPVVLDEAFQFGDYYDRALTPMTMLVDLETMEIERLMTGYDDSTLRAILGARL